MLLNTAKRLEQKLLIHPDLKANNFDLLRFLLAVAVIYSHCYVIYYGAVRDTEPFMLFSQNQTDLGGIAVNGFFIISGFLIVSSYRHSKSTLEFLKKRILRIYPGFIVAFLISMLVLGPLGTFDQAHPQGNVAQYFEFLRKKLLLLNLFTLQAPSAVLCFQPSPLPNQLNESLWTIQYEFICYLTVPFIAFFKVFRRKWVAVLVFTAAYLLLVLQASSQLFLWEGYQGKLISNPVYFPRFFTYFFAGCCVYLFRRRLQRNHLLALLALSSLITSMVWFGGFDLVAPFSLTYLLFYIAYLPHIQLQNFTRYGDFSYGTYLYAWPIQQLVMLFAGGQLTPGSLFLVSFAFTVVAAYASWHGIEKHFLKLKDNPRWLPFALFTFPVFSARK
ncbi:acyltransferase family protein [Rufibacter sediminis]|uniref:acyltransferase family protein n=1 Tax=Rufibacter sediminis TaxID=2762756 RepID=UPI00210EB662|nr:acyltransferase [Rufibacter sediminis]